LFVVVHSGPCMITGTRSRSFSGCTEDTPEVSVDTKGQTDSRLRDPYYYP
jgi:hypothetical protein